MNRISQGRGRERAVGPGPPAFLCWSVLLAPWGMAATTTRDCPDLPSLKGKERDGPVRKGPESPTTVRVRRPCALARGGTLQI